MSITMTIRDETTAGDKTDALTLDFLNERITVRELIRSRVYQEVQDYNTKQPEHFRGLIQPTDAEKTLNGYKLRQGRQIRFDTQYQKALAAFESNGFLILVGDKQVDDLDEEIVIGPTTNEATFLKLVPLVGG
ncbi:MAG: hypothetical protein GC159_23670 [Phycisphaera sp.]|nr:hypothetical protein [Phycisphaera sp.]